MSSLRNIPDDVPCKKSPNLMHPDPRKREAIAAAKFVCNTGVGGAPCHFRDECLTYALRWSVQGVWGGCDEDERKAIQRRQRITPYSLSTVAS